MSQLEQAVEYIVEHGQGLDCGDEPGWHALYAHALTRYPDAAPDVEDLQVAFLNSASTGRLTGR